MHGCREDDVAVARDIISRMRHSDRAYSVEKLFTPAQMKAVMGRLEMCLVTRMHACILSTGINTPTCSINYQFKLHEYMKLVGLGDYTIDIDEVSYDRLKSLVERTWEQRSAMRATLTLSIPELCYQLKADMDGLAVYYDSRTNDC